MDKLVYIERSHGEVVDLEVREILDNNINMYVPWYLLTSYSYYVACDPLVSDSFFDNMSKFMLKNWDNIEHFHKPLITTDDLRAGTYLGKYPKRVASSYFRLLK